MSAPYSDALVGYGATPPSATNPYATEANLAGVGTGTVTSVAQTVPSAEFAIAGSPITTSGTLAITKQTQSANRVWAGPTTGSAAQPTFRALVTADMPAGTGTVTSVGATAPVTTTGGATPTIGLDLGAGASLAVVGSKLVRAALTGDVTASSDGNATTLATVASAGTTGDASHVAQITIDAKGRTTIATAVAIALDAAAITTGTLPVARGGTALATLTAHALYVGNGASAPTALAVGATGNLLRAQTAADPVWGQAVLTTDVTGILPVANGGTGLASPTTGNLLIGAGSSAMTALAGTYNGNAVGWDGTTWGARGPGGGFTPLRGSSPLATHYSFTQWATTSTNPGTGAMRAALWICPFTGSIDRMAVEAVAGVANSVGRFGIYSQGTNGYPNALIVETGQFTTTAAQFYSATVSQALVAGTEYWFAWLGGTAASNLRVMATNGPSPDKFCALSGAAWSSGACGLTVAQTYGTMPSTFPASATVINNANATQLPLMGVRFA